jgi:hypothetical protein
MLGCRSRAAVDFTLFIAARPDEALKLRGSDIHADEHEIHVRAEIAKWDLACTIDLPFSTTLAAPAELAPLFWERTRARLDADELEAEIGWLTIPPPLDTSAATEQPASS